METDKSIFELLEIMRKEGLDLADRVFAIQET